MWSVAVALALVATVDAVTFELSGASNKCLFEDVHKVSFQRHAILSFRQRFFPFSFFKSSISL